MMKRCLGLVIFLILMAISFYLCAPSFAFAPPYLPTTGSVIPDCPECENYEITGPPVDAEIDGFSLLTRNITYDWRTPESRYQKFTINGWGSTNVNGVEYREYPVDIITTASDGNGKYQWLVTLSWFPVKPSLLPAQQPMSESSWLNSLGISSNPVTPTNTLLSGITVDVITAESATVIILVGLITALGIRKLHGYFNRS